MTIFDVYLKAAAFKLECSYPGWRTHDSGTPICIPSALDINTIYRGPLNGFIIPIDCACFYCYEYFKDSFMNDDNYEDVTNANRYRKNISGDIAEIRVLNAFQATKNLGGILIANFKRDDIRSNDRKSKDIKAQKKISHLHKNLKKFCKEDFQIDFIYLHRKYGIFVIEVKRGYSALSRENKEIPGKMYDPYGDAKRQVPICIEKVRIFFEILTEAPCNIPIYGIICFPNAHDMPDESPGIWHLDQMALSDEYKLKEFFERIPQSHVKDYFAIENFDRFAGVLATYRDVVWLSGGDNALEVNRMIQAQEFMAKKDVAKKYSETSAQKHSINRLLYLADTALFLNRDQKTCYYKPNKRKILCGLPGTGKTLLILLHIQLAAKFRGQNMAIVTNLGTKRLASKYDILISYIQKEYKVRVKPNDRSLLPEFKRNVHPDKVKDTDHFFADEVPGVFGDWDSFLARRSKLDNVFTVVGISGRSWADNIATIVDDVQQKKVDLNFNQFDIYNFQVIVRGTKNIIHYWADKYLSHLPDLPSKHWSYQKSEEVPDKVRIGHNIHGAIVEEIKVATTKEVFSNILEHVQGFLGVERAERGRRFAPGSQFRPCHIAILTTNTFAKEFIRDHLERKGFKTEALGGKNELAIKLDLNNLTLSHEYPVVIVVNYYGYEVASEAIELTLASRAIANLIVIERDRSLIQRKVDETLIGWQIFTCNPSFSTIKDAVKAAGGYLKDNIGKRSCDTALEWDEILANVRYNVIPEYMIDISPQFDRCEHFSDILQVLCNCKCSISVDACLLSELVKVNLTSDTMYFSMNFALRSLKNRDRLKKLKTLNLKDDRVYDALLKLYQEWERHLQAILDGSRDHTNKLLGYEQLLWQPITRILMTLC